jgi:SNF2 family DNA or RNA helicase
VVRFHELTATPASQTYMHLFSQVWLLDRGERFGNGITAFRERYFTFNPYVKTWKIRDGAKQEIERLISDICLVKRRERDFRIVTRTIRLPDKLMETYEEFERECVLELGDQEIDGVNAAVLCSKLLQYASGFVYDQNQVACNIHDEKIEELRSLVEETLDEPILVAYWFRESLARLQAAFPDAAVMDREGKVEASWNRREHKILLAHPQSVGHGLNLQQGGHHVVIYDLFWSAELVNQLIGRLDRPGQTKTVYAHMLCSKGTIDELVAGKLNYLDDARAIMLDRIQRLRNEISRRNERVQERVG